MSQFQLTTSLIKEITPHFVPTEDVGAIQKIQRLRCETEEAFQERQQRTKTIIKEMNEVIRSEQEEIGRKERGEDEARVLKGALEEKENAKLQVEALEGQHRVLEGKLAEVESQKHDIAESLLELKQNKLQEIPIIKHALGLYANITNLRWDYEADSIKGHITRADDVQQFELSASTSNFDAANRLWEML